MSNLETGRAKEGAEDFGLPMVVEHPAPAARGRLRSRLRRALVAPLTIVVFAVGGAAGLYFQPPGLMYVFDLLDLDPGGGARPPREAAPAAEAHVAEHVAALGVLTPAGEVRTIAPPFGAGDARVAELRVYEGDRVSAGDVIAVLDSIASFESALARAETDVAARQAALERTRKDVVADLEEAEATLRGAEAVAANARKERDRARSLLDRGVTTRAAFDAAEAAALQADREVDRARAARSRHQSAVAGGLDEQADVAVAARDLDVARAALAEARANLDKAFVKSPIDGAIIEIHAQPGEKPGAEGVADVGDIDRMTVELEVYQASIGGVRVGDAVEVTAAALERPLRGEVAEIGLSVGRQSITADDPAANTDARVVKVVAALDDASSRIASRFTNLQVIGRIYGGGAR